MTKLALYLTGALRVGLTPGALKVGAIRVADPDPVGSCVFAWIRIRFSNFSGSGSGFKISLDPDPVSAQILEQKINAERSLKVIYQKKTQNL